MTNNLEFENRAFSQNSERPWWEVRAALVATLGLLLTVLVTFISRPQAIEQTLRLAGF